MYIKQMVIQGFKSYKAQTIVEPFSPGTNVIVGRNGSGKSNFFAAIRFVLSDAYTNMNREERQALLHEGAGSAIVTAYVEITFDNSDNRFPGCGQEVILRRTIGNIKDEYSVDRKIVSRMDVSQLLESAGFSRSNPYYIVPQGRVTALTNMKESERLNLLKEVAGTQVYENRRNDSLKIMTDTQQRRAKIDELLEDVGARLAELEEEKEELRGYQAHEREKRCLDYGFLFRRQSRIREMLAEMEAHRPGGLRESTDSDRALQAECDRRIRALDENAARLRRDADLLEISRRQLDEDRRDRARALGAAELRSKTAVEGQASREVARREHEAELGEVQSQMAARRAELDEIKPGRAERRAREDELRRDLDAAEAGRARLLAKQSSGSRFKSRPERDHWLRSQIDAVGSNLAAHRANRVDADEEVATLGHKITSAEADLAALRARLENWGRERADLAAEASAAKARADDLVEERKRLTREDERLIAVTAGAREERDRAKKELDRMMDAATSRGLDFIRRMNRDRPIPGAYGTMAELLEVGEAYQLAAEQVAGASLFHYVVDNSETASLLSEALHRHHGGRITFVPLRELRIRDVDIPRANDAIPLLEKITFEDMYEKAFRQVFGKTVVCPTLVAANWYARNYSLDAITPDGDMANKRGAMTGGFIDTRRSRLAAAKRADRCRAEHDRLAAQADDMRRLIEAKHQKVTEALGEARRLERQLELAGAEHQPLQAELRTRNSDLERLRRQLEAAVGRRDGIERNMTEFTENLAAMEAEVASAFHRTLTAAEEQQLDELEARVQQLKRQWGEASAARRELDGRGQALEFDLSQNLQLKLDELTGQAVEDDAAPAGGPTESVDDSRRELKRAQRAVGAAEKSYLETDAELDQLTKKIEQLGADRAEQETARVELAAKIERQQKRIERSLQQRGVLQAELAEVTKGITNIGVLPDEAFEYEQMEQQLIEKRLRKLAETLKKYTHVNRKAFEQYTQFTQQQDQLLERRRELDTSHKSIEKLIEHLDMRKEEALQRTFKQVSREFTAVFEKLVPAGQGRLVIARRIDRDPKKGKYANKGGEDDDDEDEDGGPSAEGSEVDTYTGVGISVSFNSKTMDEQQKIQQLSGGQKSLCALCLIFALQQIESSPMVIFDEVDANLDAQYRTAVASLIQATSRGESRTQFICTTFRPEIVRTADKCYGVTFHNKTSSIDCYDAVDALQFVEGQASTS